MRTEAPNKLVYNDHWHTYWLDGKRARGVTTVAGWPDDTTTLQRWSERQVLVGVATDENILRKVATAGDDWKALNDLTWEAKAAAKANAAADRGTAIHRMLEMVVTGGSVIETAELADVRARWERFVEQHEIAAHPAWCERFAVHPADMICGRSDLIPMYDGELVVMDWKTGPNAVKYPHKTAIQLALYANAPWFAVDGTADGDKTTLTKFETNPGINTDTAYVVDIPRDGGEWALVPIDIAAGWEQVDRLLRPMKAWRDRKDLAGEPIAPKVAAAEPEIEVAPVPVEEAEIPSQIRERLAAIAQNPIRKQYAVDNWPVDLPAKITAPGWTAPNVATLGRFVAAVEQHFGEPQFDPAPQVKRADRADLDEGGQPDTDMVDAARKRLTGLDADNVAQYKQWLVESDQAYRPIKPTTERRLAITSLAIDLLDRYGPEDDALFRAVLRVIYPDTELGPDVTIGCALGSLTTVEAKHLRDVLPQISTLGLVFEDGDTARFEGAERFALAAQAA